MDKLKIGIIGAGGVGKFHVREYNNLGCEVKGILGPTKENSEQTAEMLLNSFNIKTKPYHEFDKFCEENEFDGISICTPMSLHADFIKKCLEKNFNVLSEKPLVYDLNLKSHLIAKDLFNLAEDRKKILTVNTQWLSIFPVIKEYIPEKITNFYMETEPGVKGMELLSEHLAHKNSMLIRLLPNGNAKNIRFTEMKEEIVVVEFNYSNKQNSCEVRYVFRYKEKKPKNVIFSINDKKFVRVVDENYQQKFVCDGREFKIEDPFTVSIRRFTEAIKGNGSPLANQEEILENLRLQDIILGEYQKAKK